MKLEDAFRSPFDNRLPSSLLFNPKSISRERPEMTDYLINGNINSNSNRNINSNSNGNINSNSNGNINSNENGNGNINSNGNGNINSNENENKNKKIKTKESFKVSIIEHDELINNLMVYGTGGLIILLLLELISKINK